MIRKRKINILKTKRTVNIKKYNKKVISEKVLLTFKDVEDLIDMFDSENDKIINR